MPRLLLLALAFVLAACGGASEDAVSDPAPTAAAAPPTQAVADTMSVEPVADAMPADPEVVARGTFAGDSGHDVSGEALLYRLADGSHLVRLEGFETDNGPALEVWLVRQTEGDIAAGGASLGALKSTNGDQNYPVPADVDASEFAGVSIWCEAFSVNFGAAALQ